MLKNYFPYKSFSKKKLTNYFITSNIIKAFFSAFCLSSFIFLNNFDITNSFLHVSLALIGFYLLLYTSKTGYFFTGFFIGIFWFYWISLSFRYYDLSFLIPFIIIGIALVYGAMFLIASLISDSPFVRAFFLVLVSQIHPFGFNWFNFELIFYNTPFGLTPLHVLSFMFAIIFFINYKSKIKYLSIVFLVFCLDFSNKETVKEIPFEVSIVNTNISQDIKWDRGFMEKSVKENFEKIQNAIDQNKRLIIFPETAFPMYLNQNPDIVEKLKEYSKNIAIITGALSLDDDGFYNSAYFFDKGTMQRADKVVLVPFGEEIPLPKFMVNFINRVVFDGADDFKVAREPVDFIVDDVKIRSAICYEGSKKSLHVNSSGYMSVISNNAWFLPSTEPIMQNLMLKFFATKSNTVIFHAVNGENGGIIYPRKSKIIPFFKNLKLF